MAICNMCNTSHLPQDDCFVHSGSFQSPFQLSQSTDVCMFSNYAEEATNIGGADLNIFKLLGIHEQGNMTDLTGFGTPISSGGQPTFGAIHAFDIECREWRSLARGPQVLDCAYLGYDFGYIKLANGRNQYSVETYVQKHITTINIQQSDEASQRVTSARIERSIDGKIWFGCAIVALPDDGNLNTINFKQSAAVRYWRVRPLVFNGGAKDFWTVKKLELMDYSITNINNIQDDWGFLENRDREYCTTPVALKGNYDITDGTTDLSRFGLEVPDTTTLKFHFNSMVSKLGRPIVVGDIIEIPSQTEYSVNMVGIKKYVEVTDVNWAADGFTPGWTALILRVIAAPMMAKQETMSIVGDFVKEKFQVGGAPGFLDTDSVTYAPISMIMNDRLDSAARTQVPEKGEDQQHYGIIDDTALEAATELGSDLGKLVEPKSNNVYTRDALPPGGAAYKEGEVLPAIEQAKDGQYFRLVYAKGLNIPARLYKFSIMKNRWVYLESDQRWLTNLNSTRASKFLNDPKRVNLNEVR